LTFNLNSDAQIATPTKPILVNGLASFVGQYLTVYYAFGSEASIYSTHDQVNLREVKFKINNLPITSSQTLVPSAPLIRTGALLPYQVIVFVVHAKPDFTWINADGTQAESNNGNNGFSAVSSLMNTDFNELSRRQGSPETVQYIFGTRIDFNSFIPNLVLQK
jgi:hypothetical protein